MLVLKNTTLRLRLKGIYLSVVLLENYTGHAWGHQDSFDLLRNKLVGNSYLIVAQFPLECVR